VTGVPLAATVVVAGNDKPVATDAEHGDYVKLLPAGSWDVTVTAPGYRPATFPAVATTRGQTTVLDVALSPAPTAVPAAPAAVTTLAVRPNPFNPGTTLRLTLPVPGPIRLTVHDLRGRRVRTLVEGLQPAGDLDVPWDGRDAAGQRVPSGVYIARLAGPTGRTAAKLTLLE
jgi:hypothetical protein